MKKLQNLITLFSLVVILYLSLELNKEDKQINNINQGLIKRFAEQDKFNLALINEVAKNRTRKRNEHKHNSRQCNKIQL